MKLWLFIRLGVKLFNCVDIYSPDKDEVVAVTFSNSESYINKVMRTK